jgi:adenylosuccinate synthase
MQEENQMVTAVVGANWGDEGKGKITDMLADEADIVIRFQGGANAGHTIVNNYGKFALHTLPSGVFHSHITNIIGNGVALDIPKVMSEIKSITDRNVPAPKIMISDRAQMVMPYHVLFDQYEEERLGKNSFGSTKSGIAPFYSDKYAKIGFQVSELFDEELLQAKVKRTCRRHPYLLATQSYHPILLGRPVVAPNSPPSPPRLLSSSASSPKISLTNAPAPTAEEYALLTVTIFLISYGGIPA